MQLVVQGVLDALCLEWRCAAMVHRASPVVSIEDNYDRLHYPRDGRTRRALYPVRERERSPANANLGDDPAPLAKHRG